jgi:DNA-binding transcriptional LysR family regulator
MKRIDLGFRHLRTFVAVADAGGVNSAAARLSLSQPAASRQIQALESALGVPLFDRVGRRVQLTAQGEDLLRRSRRLLEEAESLGERASALNKGETGILRVGATPQVIENTLAGLLERYRRRHPGVEVQLIEEGGNLLPRRLAHGEVQLALTAADDEQFRSRLIYPIYGLAVLSKTHRLAGRRTLDVAEFANEPLVLLRGGFASRDWFETACRAAHMRPRILLESSAPHTSIALARAGYAIAIVPSTVVIPKDRVRGIPLVQSGAAIGRWLRIAWDPDRFLPTYAKRFIDELGAHCSSRYPGREFSRRAPALRRPTVLG